MKEQKTKSPGAASTATEAELEVVSFNSEYTLKQTRTSIYYWDREAHCVEPLRTGGAQ